MRKGAKVVIVDPRRTVTANACEVEAGKENVLHLAINSGTDLALFNTLFTYIADQGWIDKDFIANSTFQGDVRHTPGRSPSGSTWRSFKRPARNARCRWLRVLKSAA